LRYQDQQASSSSRRLSVPELVPIARRKPVPDAVPLSNGLFNGTSTSEFSSRGQQMVAMATRQKSPTNRNHSILDLTCKEDSKKQYMALLQQLAPTLYQPSGGSLISLRDIKITAGTQTESVDLTSEGKSVKELVDLTDDKDSKSSSKDESTSSKDEKLNSLMMKLNCRSSYTTKADTLRARFEEERKLKEREIEAQEAELEQRRRETEELHTQIRKRILERPVCFEDIIYRIDHSDEEDEEEVEYPQLTKTHNEVIKRAISGGHPSEVVVSKFGQNITRNDLCTLLNLNWLNDEVINFYMNLIIERSKENENLPKAYCMNTFFIPTLMSRGYAGVKRWTRKVDIFSYDLIPVPVHVGKIHWCMAVIRVKEKIIRYYDSMGNPNEPVLEALEQYLIDEARDKKQETLDTSDWVKQSVTDCPHQTNGSDCGVFSCMFAEHLTRNAGFTFGQGEMPYFRHKMIYEIATGELLM